MGEWDRLGLTVRGVYLDRLLFSNLTGTSHAICTIIVTRIQNNICIRSRLCSFVETQRYVLNHYRKTREEYPRESATLFKYEIFVKDIFFIMNISVRNILENRFT